MSAPVHLISLGAGVQSSTMALMAAAGEIEPMPLAAIFADTQDEPASVYRWLDWLESRLPFPVVRVTKGQLSASAVQMRISKKGLRYSKTDIPFFTLDPATGNIGKIGNRACTRDYKLKPIIGQARTIVGRKALFAWRRVHDSDLKAIAKIAAAHKGKKAKKKWLAIFRSGAYANCQRDPLVVQWVGISLDEITRAKPSREPWALVRHPLLERRMTRLLCLEWLRKRGFPEPPRSACVYYPFHGNDEWRRLQTEEPKEFQRAVEFERAVQEAKRNSDNINSTPFLHRSCKPLDTIDFRSDEERGQLSLWQDECEGMCGV